MSSIGKDITPEGSASFRKIAALSGKSANVTELALSSWAKSTKASYSTYIKYFVEYCKVNHIIDPYNATFDQGLEFIAQLHNVFNYPFGSCAIARSALSAILPLSNGITFGKDPIVSKVMKGIFRASPSLPKCTVIWDPAIVLNYINSLPPNSQLMLETLTKKLCFLLALLSGQRSQSIGSLRLTHYYIDDTKVVFYIPTILKTTRPGFHQAPLEFRAFTNNVNWCPVKCFLEYKTRTELIRENSSPDDHTLFISYAQPYKPVKSATLARYIKTFLADAGIDVTVFTAHSTRKASTSLANNLGLSVKDLIKAAGWTNIHTFQRFYNLPVKMNFGDIILSQS